MDKRKQGDKKKILISMNGKKWDSCLSWMGGKGLSYGEFFYQCAESAQENDDLREDIRSLQASLDETTKLVRSMSDAFHALLQREVKKKLEMQSKPIMTDEKH